MKTIIKLLVILVHVFSLSAFSQEYEIVKILNKELEKETKAQKENPENYYGAKFKVVKKFSVDNNVLSIEIKKENDYENSTYTEKQEIDIRKINRIVKDLNVIFETEPDAVKITETNSQDEKTRRTSSMFFLKLSHEKQNEKLANQLVIAFKNAGLKIEKGVWAD